ncbi:MAG: putative Ig domain-containing protein [Verrucomicrobiota bacterium]|nr:putative Ig domain-containing protein [Verrucomicrobiota bacterium]
MARGIVRLLPDGSVDSSFAAGSGAQWTQTAATSTFFPFIEDMAVQPDGKLLVVGTFEAFNGVTRAGIASLNADGSVDTSFTPVAKRNKYSPNTTRLAAQPDGSFLLSGPYSFPNESDPSFIHINTIGGVPAVGSPTVAAALVAQSFSYQIEASGQPTTYSVSGLPPGLSFDPATGKISGTPTAAGTFTITVTATNGSGTSAAHQVTLTISPSAAAPAITSAISATAYLNRTFTYQIIATNEPTSFRADNLPSGLTIDESSGTISGVPPYTSTFAITIRALNSTGVGSALLTLTVETAPRPANDDFANAQAITGTSGSVTGSNVSATRELDEPLHDDTFGSTSVWYSWTAPATGNVVFDANGSSFPALLAVYAGNSVNNLAFVAAYPYYGSGMSRVQFSARAGSVYKIAVAGFGGATGSVSLEWHPGAPLVAFSTLAGTPPGDADGTGSSARFAFPWYVASDANGTVYVSDRSNHTIRKISPGGVVTTFAGLSGTSGSTDGTGSGARFNRPEGLALDSAGNLYVADTGNSTIRQVTPAGVVTTFAGTATYGGSSDGTGPSARFNLPESLAVDSAGTVYVADTYNHTIRKISPARVVTTVAGLAGSSGSADGTGNAARFNMPTGLRVDGTGNVYIADAGNHIVRKMTPAATVTTLAGTAGATGTADGTGAAARFNEPRDVVISSSGNLFVSDSGNHTIRQITPAGVVTTYVGIAGVPGSLDLAFGMAAFYRPIGLALDGAGNLFVADVNNSTVRKVSTTAFVVTTLAGAASPGSNDGPASGAKFFSPWSCTVDASGNVFVADTYNHTIRKITPAGTVTTFAGMARNPGSANGTGTAARFTYPTDVAVAPDGNLFVADFSNSTIRKITPQGVVTTFAGSPGQVGSLDGQGSAARFGYIWGIGIDSNGNILVADRSNHTIRKITPDAVVTTIAGMPGVSGSADGVGSAARFYFPSDVAADASGNVYVADSSNWTVRKITPDGTVTTLAGTAGSAGGFDGTGPAARLSGPNAITCDSAGNLILSDGNTLRMITPAGVVSTLGGTAFNSGSKEGQGSNARFNFLGGGAFDASGRLFLADISNHTIRIGRPVAPLTLATARSTMSHGNSGSFSIDLPMSGGPGIEPRNGAGNHTLTVTFNNQLTSGDAAVTSGAGTIAGAATVSGNTFTVNLTGITNAQIVTIALRNVTDTDGQVAPDIAINIGFLIGDTNGDGSVNASDALQTRNRSGQATDATNFRSDVNTDGFINAADAAAVRARSGTGLSAANELTPTKDETRR